MVKIFQKENSKIFCIAIKGSMSAVLTPENEKMIQNLLQEDIAVLLFDLSSSTYLGSRVLRVILEVTREIRQKRGQVILCSPNQYVREIFEVSGYGCLIPIADSVDSGLNAHLSFINPPEDLHRAPGWPDVRNRTVAVS